MLPDGPPVLGSADVPGVWLNLGHGSRLGSGLRLGALARRNAQQACAQHFRVSIQR